jgi:uncharacterized protein (DUF2336 family)
MTAHATLLSELESAIQTGSGERRTEILRRVTDLFLNAAPQISDEQTAVFGDVFEHLIREIEWKAVLELSDRVASVDNAPHKLVRRLAYDDSIEISGPVLERSDRLDDDELVEIARTKSQAHLAAIAGRAQIHEAVTDMLVERGDQAVMLKVAANDGARLSALSFRTLVDHSEDDEDLAVTVAKRRELPPQLFRQLVSKATLAVQQRMMSTANPGTAAEIKRVLAGISREVEEKTVAQRDYDAAKRAVMILQQQNRLGTKALMDYALAREFEEMVATLAALTGVSVELVDRLMGDTSGDGLVILCKSIGLDWNTARAVFVASADGEPMHVARTDEISGRYLKLSAYAAQRVIRFWQAREKLGS